MSCLIIIGAQWGDEGKGKVIDLLSADMDLVVRYQGGANAGHTVVVGDGPQDAAGLPVGTLGGGGEVLHADRNDNILLKRVVNILARLLFENCPQRIEIPIAIQEILAASF